MTAVAAPFADAVAQVDAFSRALTTHHPVPGGIVVVVDQGAVLAQIPFGTADLAAGEPVAPGHLFEIGSISKVFTSLLVNQLVDEGRLDLDEGVTTYLPWVELGPTTPAVTLRRLLNHTAGLVIGADALPDEAAQVWSLRDRATAPPGEHFHYSNAGYLLLGQVLGAATGLPLADLLRQKIFEPLGMRTALGSVTHADRPTLATGYAPAVLDRPWLPGDPLAPATWFEVAAADGSIAATADDLGRLLQLLLGDGVVRGRQVVSAAALERMRTVTGPAGEPVADAPGTLPVTSSRYGLGINVERVDGHECLTHGGGMVGFASFVVADRTAGVGVGVLTNADGDCAAAQVLARVAHHAVLAALGRAPALTVPTADLRVRAGELDALASSAALGTTTAGSPCRLTWSVDEHGGVLVRANGRTGRVWRSWTGRYVSDHPDLRLYALTRTDGEAAVDDTEVPPRLKPYTGHYRSYSPWFTDMRLVVRWGRLFLTAPRGVEAPDDDVELVEVSPDVWRIGTDPWLPERLVAGPVVDGVMVGLVRDGCGYSRTFTP